MVTITFEITFNDCEAKYYRGLCESFTEERIRVRLNYEWS